MLQTTFTQQVLNDIHEFLNQNTKVFTNKRDFQMNLAVYLKCVRHYDVEVEYHVPSYILSTLIPQTLPERCTYYPWLQGNSDKPQEMYVDIVVSNGEEYVPIELKYKKKELKGDVVLFGKNMGKSVILKDDGAHDFRRYSFWKDVRRTELLVKSFERVKNGIVLFLTNDDAYKTASVTGTNSEHLAMGNGTDTYHKDTNCCWPFNPLMTDTYKSCPSFKLEDEHDVNWNGYTFSGVGFHCAEVIVHGAMTSQESLDKYGEATMHTFRVNIDTYATYVSFTDTVEDYYQKGNEHYSSKKEYIQYVKDSLDNDDALEEIFGLDDDDDPWYDVDVYGDFILPKDIPNTPFSLEVLDENEQVVFSSKNILDFSKDLHFEEELRHFDGLQLVTQGLTRCWYEFTIQDTEFRPEKFQFKAAKAYWKKNANEFPIALYEATYDNKPVDCSDMTGDDKGYFCRELVEADQNGWNILASVQFDQWVREMLLTK